MEETTTAKYVHSLAFALHPISPALAACHASRARRLRPQTLHSDSARTSPPSSCPRCGIFLLDGTGHVRSVHPSTATKKRKRNGMESSSSSAGRFSEITCSSCGHVERTPRPLGNAVLFPKVRRRAPSDASGFDSTRTIAPMPQSSQPTAAAITVSNSPSMHTPSPSSHQQPSPSISILPQPPSSSTHSRSQSSTPQPLQPPPPPTKKARAKKKSGLQELLARNKEKQAGNKLGDGSREAPGSGLASFLSSL